MTPRIVTTGGGGGGGGALPYLALYTNFIIQRLEQGVFLDRRSLKERES